MDADRNSPATKGDLADLEERLTGSMRELEERLTGSMRELEDRLTGSMRELEEHHGIDARYPDRDAEGFLWLHADVFRALPGVGSDGDIS
jgi:hypothetical protein